MIVIFFRWQEGNWQSENDWCEGGKYRRLPQLLTHLLCPGPQEGDDHDHDGGDGDDSDYGDGNDNDYDGDGDDNDHDGDGDDSDVIEN